MRSAATIEECGYLPGRKNFIILIINKAKIFAVYNSAGFCGFKARFLANR